LTFITPAVTEIKFLCVLFIGMILILYQRVRVMLF
jgi:hypothetical protein